MIEVELPDGTIAEFPDGMPPSDIEKALAQQFGAAPEAPESVDQGGSVANPFLQGATFGFGDEGLALLSAAIGKVLPESMGGLPEGVSFSDAYEGIRQEINADTQAFEERNPATAAVAEIAGGLGTGGLGVAKAVGTVAKGGGMLSKVGTGAATGAVEGALYGAGTADPGERAEGGARGAVVGGLTGGLGTAAFSKVSDSVAQRAMNARKLREGSGSKAVAKLKLTPQGKIKADRTAKRAVKQGFGEGLVQQIKTASPEDKRGFLDMVQVAKRSMDDNRFAANNRINKVIGERLAERVSALNKVNRQASSKLDDEAKKLVGKAAYDDYAVRQFANDLEDLGITIGADDAGKLKVDLTGSDIEGADAAEGFLNRILNRAENVRDAFDAHKLKKYIDRQVVYGKQDTGLKGDSLRIVKRLRHNIDTALDENYPSYNQVNTQYADTRNALDLLQNAWGKNVDMFSESAPTQLGIQSRKLLSNYASGVNQHDAILNAEQVLAKYNQKVQGNIMDLVSVESALRGIVPQNLFNTFQGEIQKAVTPGRVMRGASGDKFALGEIAGDVIRRSRGITPESSLNALEELIKDSL